MHDNKSQTLLDCHTAGTAGSAESTSDPGRRLLAKHRGVTPNSHASSSHARMGRPTSRLSHSTLQHVANQAGTTAQGSGSTGQSTTCVQIACRGSHHAVKVQPNMLVHRMYTYNVEIACQASHHAVKCQPNMLLHRMYTYNVEIACQGGHHAV